MSSLLVGRLEVQQESSCLSCCVCVGGGGGRGKAPLKRTSRLPLSHGQRNVYCSTSRNVVEDGAHNFSWQESTKKNCLKWITAYLETRIHLFQYVLIISLTQHCLVKCLIFSLLKSLYFLLAILKGCTSFIRVLNQRAAQLGCHQTSAFGNEIVWNT